MHRHVDLRKKEEEIIKDYKSNVCRNIKRAEKEGLCFEIADKNQSNIDIFQKMYQKSMEILEARKFLYFNNSYFTKLVACENSRIIFVKNRFPQYAEKQFYPLYRFNK